MRKEKQSKKTQKYCQRAGLQPPGTDNRSFTCPPNADLQSERRSLSPLPWAKHPSGPNATRTAAQGHLHATHLQMQPIPSEMTANRSATPGANALNGSSGGAPTDGKVVKSWQDSKTISWAPAMERRTSTAPDSATAAADGLVMICG